MDRGRTTSTSSQGSAEGGVGRTRSFSTSSGGGRTIVMAVDPSDFAKYAFEWFLENIHRSDDMVVLVHCPEAPRLPTFSFKSPMAPPVDEWKKILDDMNSKTRKLEEDYETTCIQRKLKYKVKGEAMKQPGEGIIKVAENEGANMIVMGTRGLGTVRRALIGSVSDYVVRHSCIPVVIVPAKKIFKRRESEAGFQFLRRESEAHIQALHEVQNQENQENS